MFHSPGYEDMGLKKLINQRLHSQLDQWSSTSTIVFPWAIECTSHLPENDGRSFVRLDS